jgi:hypothetical protein
MMALKVAHPIPSSWKDPRTSWCCIQLAKTKGVTPIKMFRVSASKKKKWVLAFMESFPHSLLTGKVHLVVHPYSDPSNSDDRV